MDAMTAKFTEGRWNCHSHESPEKPKAADGTAKCEEESMGFGVRLEDYIYYVFDV